MRKATILLTVLAIAQCAQIKGNPTEERTTSTHLAGHQGQKVHGYYPRSDWSYFHPSWSLPSLPSISSVTSFFKDDDDDNTKSRSKSIKNVIKRIEALEKAQKEILELLKKIAQREKTPEGTLAATSTSGSQSNLTHALPNVVTTTITKPDDKQSSKIKDSNESSGVSSESVEVSVTDDRVNPEDLESISGTTIKSISDNGDLSINGTSEGPGTVVSLSTDFAVVGNPEELGSAVPELSSVSSTSDEPKVTETVDSTKNTNEVTETDLSKGTDGVVSMLKNEDSSSTGPGGQSLDSANLLVPQNKDHPDDLPASGSEATGPQVHLENQRVPEDTAGQSDPSTSQLRNTGSDQAVTKDLKTVDQTIQTSDDLFGGDKNEKLQEAVSTKFAETEVVVQNVKVEEDTKIGTTSDRKEGHAEENRAAEVQGQTTNSEVSEKKEPSLPTSVVLS